jgi:hypothetical protein
MSPDFDTFVAKCLRGDCLCDEIDDYVDRWHDGDSEQPLSEFLGFTPEEYAVWLEMPQLLEWIFYARKTEKSIAAMLPEINTANPSLEARALSPEDSNELFQWLKRTGRL